MHDGEGPADICDHVGVGSVKGRLAGDDHVVETVFCELSCELPNGGFQPAPDTIARDGVAEFFCDGEAKSRSGIRAGLSSALARFYQARRHRGPASTAHSEKFRANLER